MAEPLPLELDGDEPLLVVPPGGWTVDHLDAMPETNIRYELTDGALTVSPSPSNLHQVVCSVLWMALTEQAPEDLIVTQGVEIRFDRQLTRIPDVLVVRTEEPRRHWFTPSEVLLAVEVESPGSHLEDRALKPALYAQHGIPSFWRVTTAPPRITTHALAGDGYRPGDTTARVVVDEPFPIDLDLVDRLPRWAR